MKKRMYAGIKATGMESTRSRPADGRNKKSVNRPKHLKRRGRRM